MDIDKLKELLKDWRVILYLILIIASIIILIPKEKPNYVIVADVLENSSADKVGITPGTKVYAIDDCVTRNVQEFYSCLNEVAVNKTYIVTDKGTFTVNLSNLGITVSNPSVSPLKFGIDIVGGTRVILEPKEKDIPEDLVKEAAQVIERRLNIYGVRQIEVRTVTDFSGNHYIVVEFPKGEEYLLQILRKQGKFEAKIGNTTVLTGEDIIDVCRSADCSRVIPVGNGYMFSFQVTITKEAAERITDVLKDYPVERVYEGGTVKYYIANATLDLYLDGKLVSSLRIEASFKYKPITTPSIVGYGKTKEEAMNEMKLLQTVLMSGALPVELKIARIDQVSPTIGSYFFKEFIYAIAFALLGVAVVIYLRYRNAKVSGLIIGNMLVETLATLAVAAIIHWTMDIPSLAGLVIAIGTGVDDQVVIADELLYEGKTVEEKKLKITERIKRAFFIVISSYLAFAAAMLPLLKAGAGALRGFAVTTLIGISIGALITRPAFARILEKII